MAVSAILFPLIIRLARGLNVVSPQDYRRKSNTPLLGGLVIYTTTTLFSVIQGWQEVYLTLIFSFPLVVSALLDDVIELSSKLRGFIQVCCVIGWVYFSPHDQIILTQLGLPLYLALPLIVFWVVGIINALNMIDGQDLEAGTFSLIATISLAAMFWGRVDSYFLLALAGTISGFLFFNKPPAKIYMGDCGSMFLGFALSVQSLKIPFAGEPTYYQLLVPLMLFAFPEIDAILAIGRRLKNSNSIMSPDRDHIHHKLTKVGFTVKQSAVVIFGVVFYSCFTTLANYYFSDPLVLVTINFLAIVGMLVALGALFYIENKLASQVSNMSQSLIFKYLKSTQPSSLTAVNPKKFSMVVYDLLPYYKEIQMRGVAEVNSFVRDFSRFVREHHTESQYHFFGSYTVITVSERKFSARASQNNLVKAYYDFLNHHEVMKSESPIPWGMSFYTDKSKGENVLRKFGIPVKNQAIISLDQSA